MSSNILTGSVSAERKSALGNLTSHQNFNRRVVTDNLSGSAVFGPPHILRKMTGLETVQVEQVRKQVKIRKKKTVI